MQILVGVIDRSPEYPGRSAPVNWLNPLEYLDALYPQVRRPIPDWKDADPIWFRSYWWIGDVPDGWTPNRFVHVAGRHSDIWNRTQAAFPEFIADPDRWGFIFKAEPVEGVECIRKVGGMNWIHDNRHRPAPEEKVIDLEGQLEPAVEYQTEGVDRIFWEWLGSLFIGVGVVGHIISEYIPLVDTNTDGLTAPSLFGIIRATMSPAEPYIGGLFQAWNSDIIALMNDIEKWSGKDLDADEILGAVNIWAGTEAGQHALTGIVAMYVARHKGKQIATSAADKHAINALSLSDYLDLIHDIANPAELVEPEDDIVDIAEKLLKDRMEALPEGTTETATVIIKEMGHYLKRRSESHGIESGTDA